MAIKHLTKPGKSTEINWDGIRDEYIQQNLASSEVRWTLRQVADLYGLAHGTLRNKAAKDGWSQQLEAKRAEARKVTLDALREAEGMFNEVEVRVRQARFGQRMSMKAMAKITTLDPDKLTVPQAIELAKIGMEQERRALGMPDRYEFVGVPDTEGRENNLRVLDDLIATLERKAAAIEGESIDVSDSGKTTGVSKAKLAGNSGPDSGDAAPDKGAKG